RDGVQYASGVSEKIERKPHFAGAEDPSSELPCEAGADVAATPINAAKRVVEPQRFFEQRPKVTEEDSIEKARDNAENALLLNQYKTCAQRNHPRDADEQGRRRSRRRTGGEQQPESKQ